MMPLTSQVGRDQIISSTLRPCSPAGTDSPTSPQELAAIELQRVPIGRRPRPALGDAVVEAGAR